MGNKGEKFALFLARTKKTLGECKTIEGKQATWHSFGSGEFLAASHRIFVQTKFSFREREEGIFYVHTTAIYPNNIHISYKGDTKFTKQL